MRFSFAKFVWVLTLAMCLVACGFDQQAADEASEQAGTELVELAERLGLEVHYHAAYGANPPPRAFNQQAPLESNGYAVVRTAPIGRINGPDDLSSLVEGLQQDGYSMWAERCNGNYASALFEHSDGHAIRIKIGVYSGDAEMTVEIGQDHQQLPAAEYGFSPLDPGCWPAP